MLKQISAKYKIVIIPVLHSVSIVPVYMSYITDHVWIQYKMYMYMQKYSISYYFIKWKVQTTLTFLYMYIVHKYIWCGMWISLIPFAWLTNLK